MPNRTRATHLLILKVPETTVRVPSLCVSVKNFMTISVPADTTSYGSVGLAELQQSPKEIDIILLDLMMPGMSGMEVLEKVQALERRSRSK